MWKQSSARPLRRGPFPSLYRTGAAGGFALLGVIQW